MRLLVLAAAFLGLLHAQDAREIVRRAVELDRRSAEAWRPYAFNQRNEVKEFDGGGKLKKSDDRTWDVTVVDGSPYRRLIARNGQPISAAEQQTEQDKLKFDAAQRRQESPQVRERRIKEWHQKQDKQRESLKELPEAFDFRIAAQETLGGVPAWVIDATPRKGYKPKLSSASFFPKVKARLWIAKKDNAWVRIDMEALDTISFGTIVLRLARGSRLVIDQVHVDNDVWLPSHATVEASARILLVKFMRAEYHFTFSDYRKLD